jgi:Baculovirus FP protein
MASSCAACTGEANYEEGFRKCIECNITVAHLKCAKLVGKGTERNWKCNKCTGNRPQSSTPTTTETFAFPNPKELKNLEENLLDKIQASMSSAFKDLQQNLKETIQDELQNISRKVDEQNKRINTHEKAISSQSKKIEALQNENAALQLQITDLQQAQIARKIEIHGVPHSENENLSQMLQELAKAIKLTDTLNGATFYRGRKLRNGPPVVVIEFENMETKNQWLNSKKSAEFRKFEFVRKYSEATLNKPGDEKNKKEIPQLQMYEQLTYHTRQLLFAVREAAKINKFTFVWTKNGKIFVRKDKNAALIRINRIDDIASKISLSNNERGEKGDETSAKELHNNINE